MHREPQQGAPGVILLFASFVSHVCQMLDQITMGCVPRGDACVERWHIARVAYAYHGSFVLPPRRRQVSIEEGESKAKELNVMFIETSAKAG